MERKIHNFPSVIDIALTLKEEGFDPTLTGYQKKHVWVSCRYCGKPNRVYGANLKKAGSACHKDCRIKEQVECGSPFANPEIKEKAQANRTKNISQDELNKRISIGRKNAQHQIEETNLAKYGVRNPFQSEEVKEKIRATCLQKFGVNHPQQNASVRNKTITTNFERYGTNNPMQNSEVVEQMSDSWRQRVIDNPDLYKIRTLARSDVFWKEIIQGASLSDVANKFGVLYQSIASILSLPEFKETWRKSYSYPRRQKQNSVAKAISDCGLYVEQDVTDIIAPLQLDMVIREKKFAIEFNGSAWHSELFVDKEQARMKHALKSKACDEKGYQLFHIFEKTWDDRSPQILNLIKSKLGYNKRIFARQCSISHDHCPAFIDANHIQGESTGVLKYFNLVHENRIVGTMTASLHHYAGSDRQKEIVLSRLCFEDGLTVVGGASKLFSAFATWAKNENYTQILSWSDNIYTNGGIYPKLGFTLGDTLLPDYFYWDMKKNEYISKRSQTKKKTNCPVEMTEREWAIERGLYRIWDCGKKRWEYQLR
jgi:hypothetical protein